MALNDDVNNDKSAKRPALNDDVNKKTKNVKRKALSDDVVY